MPTPVRLDPSQLTAAHAPPGDLVILAGPGTGKTATLVERITYLMRTDGLDPSRVWALCHTTRAAGELSSRLRARGAGAVAVTTVHAAAWRQLKRFWGEAGYDGEPKLLSSPFSMVSTAMRKVCAKRYDNDVVADVVAELSWAAARRLDGRSYTSAAKRAHRTAPVPEFTAVFAEYRRAKRAAGMLDFTDVLHRAAQMLDLDIGEQIRARLDAVFIDEYQDIDPAQQALVDAWCSNGASLCVVGDVDQCIYEFKGADPTYLENFTDAHPGATAVILNRSWRSTPQVLDWVNKLRTDLRTPLVTSIACGPDPRVETFASEHDEEVALTDQLTAWHRAGVDLGSIAVLYRFNASAARLESALTRAGVPYNVTGANKFFERSDVREVLVEFGKRARVDQHLDGVTLLGDVAADLGWDPQSPPPGAGIARQRFEAISALMALAATECVGLTAAWLLGDLQQRAREAHDPSPGGVTLATLHSVKGAEFDAVWIAGVVEGQLPSSYARSDDEVTAERRLFHVGVSRARTHVVVSWAAQRHNGWKGRPSRFLDHLVLGPDSTLVE